MQYPLIKFLFVLLIIFLIPIAFIINVKKEDINNQVLIQKIDSFASAFMAKNSDLMNSGTRAIIITKILSPSNKIEVFTIDTETFKSLEINYMLLNGDKLLHQCQKLLTKRSQITNDFDIKHVEKLKENLAYPTNRTLVKLYLTNRIIVDFWDLIEDIRMKCTELQDTNGFICMLFDREAIQIRFIYFKDEKAEKKYTRHFYRFFTENSVPFAKECALYMFSHYLS